MLQMDIRKHSLGLQDNHSENTISWGDESTLIPCDISEISRHPAARNVPRTATICQPAVSREYKEGMRRPVDSLKMAERHKHSEKLTVFQPIQEPKETFGRNKSLASCPVETQDEDDEVRRLTDHLRGRFPRRSDNDGSNGGSRKGQQRQDYSDSKESSQFQRYKQSYGTSRVCTRCGYKSCKSLISPKYDCIAKDKPCLKCLKYNHFASQCWSGKNQNFGGGRYWNSGYNAKINALRKLLNDIL